MSIAQRYQPSHVPGESCWYGIDYSNILPLGVTIASADLEIFRNTNPVSATSDFGVGTANMIIQNRRAYCEINGGAEGVDYQFRWSVSDSLGNTWPRTFLVLCAQAS